MVRSKEYITIQKQEIFSTISLWLYAPQAALKENGISEFGLTISVFDLNLKEKYITVKDPLNVCQNLKERFDHHKQEVLANASTFFRNIK